MPKIFILRFFNSESVARAVSVIFSEALPSDVAVSFYERKDDPKIWQIEIFFNAPPDRSFIKNLLLPLIGKEKIDQVVYATLEERDWVEASLEGLTPVRAGKFLVYGRHDRSQARFSDVDLEIIPSLAFGTGHHGTTFGCLFLLHFLLAKRNFRVKRALDVGAGTGVLAIACARMRKTPVWACDIDPIATEIAKKNVVANGVYRYVKTVCASGTRQRSLASLLPCDIVFANILTNPLITLANALTRKTSQKGILILSGFLSKDAQKIRRVYQGKGFSPLAKIVVDDWVSFAMTRHPNSFTEFSRNCR